MLLVEHLGGPGMSALLGGQLVIEVVVHPHDLLLMVLINLFDFNLVLLPEGLNGAGAICTEGSSQVL